MTQSQNQNQPAKLNVFSAMEQKIAEGKKLEAQQHAAAQKPEHQGPVKPDDKKAAQQYGAGLAAPAQQGDTAAKKH